MRNIISAILLSTVFQFPLYALESACYPNAEKHPEVKNWPICAIYLHGLHPSNDRGSYTKYEAKNRPILEEFSDDNLMNRHCRMAAPVAPDGRGVRVRKHTRTGRSYITTQYVRSKYRDWQHQPLKSVEAAAQKACGGASLQNGRALIGFSAGGWEAYHLANDDCSTLAEYSRVVAIGLPELGRRNGTWNAGCKRSQPQFTLLKTHDFPTQFSEAVQRSILASIPSGYNYASSQPRTKTATTTPD
jgi:hypothetical protein